jgi:hypothetical protein
VRTAGGGDGAATSSRADWSGNGGRACRGDRAGRARHRVDTGALVSALVPTGGAMPIEFGEWIRAHDNTTACGAIVELLQRVQKVEREKGEPLTAGGIIEIAGLLCADIAAGKWTRP